MAASPANNGQADALPSHSSPPRRTWRILLDGQELTVHEGQTVAAVLLAAGRRAFRRTARGNQPRGFFCGMGICFDCLMQIDGRPNVRACQTLVHDGMCVTNQQGEGAWEPVP
jgi:predicted molibdopterin-dependent oxidoreductase YjgC